MSGRMPSKWIVAASVLIAGSLGAKAQTVEQFYKGKTIHLVIGYGPGGGYDAYGRLAAEFLGRHLPGNPTIVPENMPGGASLRAIEYLANLAPRDGSYLGSVQQELALTSIIEHDVRYDPSKLNYVGRFAANIDLGVALPKSGIKSIADLRTRLATVGTDQAGSMAVAYARYLIGFAGMKLKIVTGYTGSAEIQLAMERGEVDINGSYSLPAVALAHPDWFGGNGAAILYQNALERFPKLPDTPTLLDLAQSDEGKQVARVLADTAEVGRAILTTPGVPADRLKALRAAFQATLTDPDFLAAVKARRLIIDPATGEELDGLTAQTLELPSPTIHAVDALFKK